MSENKNMGPCRTCGEQIALTAKVCPKCGQKKPIKGRLRKRYIIIGALLLAVYLLPSPPPRPVSAEQKTTDEIKDTVAPDRQNLSANVPNDVPNQIDTSSCNIRQLWFINTLLEGEKVFAPDIAAHWRVTAKTAKRDITGLKSAGLIVYRGTRRSGFYELAHDHGKIN